MEEGLAEQRNWLCWELKCKACAASWRVRRAAGDTFYLRREGPGGIERSLPDWYAQMKTGLALSERTDPAAGLAEDETLYLASRRMTLWLEAQAPDGLPAKDETTATPAGGGRLFLSSRRVIWRAESLGATLPAWETPLDDLGGVYTLLNQGLAAVAGRRLVFWRFLEESPLKWLTYFGLLAGQRRQAGQRTFETSHY